MTDDAFCQAIAEAPEDTTRRLVYADWLEDQGDPRAAFLRADLRLASLPADDPERPLLLERLREIAANLNPDWLARLDRTPIENCIPPARPRKRRGRRGSPPEPTHLEFTYACPLRWELLPEGPHAQFRHCGTCNKLVYYCATVTEAQDHAWQGHCVAVDSRLARTPGDLELPMMTMGIIALEQERGEDEDRLV